MRDIYGSISFTHGNPEFKKFATGGTGARAYQQKVSYKAGLDVKATENLSVALAISGIGFTHSGSIGQSVIRTSATAIDPLSFQLKLETWGNTYIEFIDLTWHFFSENPNPFQIENI